MINKIIIVGRITHPFEMKGNDITKVIQITLACACRNKKVDFIQVTVFNQLAEYLYKYAAKGDLIYVEGRVQNSVYEKDDIKFNTLQIVAQNVEILLKKQDVLENEMDAEEDGNVAIYDADNLPF